MLVKCMAGQQGPFRHGLMLELRELLRAIRDEQEEKKIVQMVENMTAKIKVRSLAKPAVVPLQPGYN